MNVREFVRGGYKEGDSPVVVVNGGIVAGTWFPRMSAITVKPAPVQFADRTIGTEAPAFRPVPKPTKQTRAKR